MAFHHEVITGVSADALSWEMKRPLGWMILTRLLAQRETSRVINIHLALFFWQDEELLSHGIKFYRLALALRRNTPGEMTLARELFVMEIWNFWLLCVSGLLFLLAAAQLPVQLKRGEVMLTLPLLVKNDQELLFLILKSGFIHELSSSTDHNSPLPC